MKDHYKPKQIEVERRLLKVQRVVGENVEQKTIEAKVNLPVAAIKVMDVIATLENVRGEVKDDGVLVKGVIHKQVFYVDQGNLVRHLAEDIPFRVFVDVEGAEEHMRAQIDASIEDISWSVIHQGMAIKQDIVVRVFAKVTETEQVEVVTDVPGVDVVTELLRVESVVGEDTVRETINPTVELPVPAIKVFDIRAEVQDVTFEIKRDTVLVRGTIHKQIFFVDKTNVVRHFPEDVTFTLGVDIPGATPDMDAQVDVDVMVDDWRILGVPDSKHHHDHKGHDKHDFPHAPHKPHHPPIPDHPMPPHMYGQTLRQTLVIEAFVKVVEPLQLDVVVDVPGFEVETMLLKVDEVVAHVKDTETIDAEVVLPMDIIKVYSIMASIRNLRYEIRNGSVVVRGVIHKQIFFVDNANLLRHFPENIPFSIPVDVPEAEEGMRAHVRAKIVGDIDWTLRRGNVVMQTILVAVDVKVTQEVQLEVVTDVIGAGEVVGECPPHSRPYIVKPGDTLFAIAQAHHVTVDAILRINPQIKDPDVIDVGMRICIPEKRDWKG
ncbi:MAG: SPOCS domain-containing protein [bacterium]|jgi:hypothetical protein